MATVLVVAIAVAGWFFRDQLGFGQSPENALAQVAKDYSDAVGLVVVVHPKLSDGKPTPMATA